MNTTIAQIKEIAAQKKALVKKFHEDVDALFAKKRADIKALREQEAALLLQLKAEKLAAKDEPTAEDDKTACNNEKAAA